jgi:hypothetical protein
MTGLMAAILFFSSLSVVFTTQPTTQNQTQTQQITTEPESPQTTQEQTETQQPANTEPDPPQNTQEQNNNLTENENATEFESGTIKTVGVAVYLNRKLNNPLSSINWGTLKPGTKTHIRCYVQNTGQSSVILQLETSNWTPSKATNYLTLTWNYKGQQLDSNQTIPIILTLTISENIQQITSFNFDIIIIGN